MALVCCRSKLGHEWQLMHSFSICDHRNYWIKIWESNAHKYRLTESNNNKIAAYNGTPWEGCEQPKEKLVYCLCIETEQRERLCCLETNFNVILSKVLNCHLCPPYCNIFCRIFLFCFRFSALFMLRCTKHAPTRGQTKIVNQFHCKRL